MSKSIDAKKLFDKPKSIEEFVHNRIKWAIDTSITSHYSKLIEYEKMGHQYVWINRLTVALLNSLDAKKIFQQLLVAPQIAGEKLEAKLEHIAPGVLSAKLSVRGVDRITNSNFRAIFFGGEYKDSEGETLYVFDAYNTFDKSKVQKAADDLKEFFKKQFKEEFGDSV